jgi:membrane-bound inhibitor of C-type lysozyme
MKTLIALFVILVVVGCVTVFLVKGNENEQKTELQSEVSPSSVVYVSTETNETIDVQYAEGKALLNGIGYQDVEFVITESASGAKYVSQKENLSLWSKGNEITLARGRQTIFVGTDANSVLNEVPQSTAVSDEIATSSIPESIATTTEEVDVEVSSTTVETL